MRIPHLLRDLGVPEIHVAASGTKDYPLEADKFGALHNARNVPQPHLRVATLPERQLYRCMLPSQPVLDIDAPTGHTWETLGAVAAAEKCSTE